ncbi:MAG: HEAT repeat domain-containing protein [Leptolyngbyaceae bacterium]|nr:HEAT repeat domain-containing protein [Leptolyngbyaceae bacterium]
MTPSSLAVKIQKSAQAPNWDTFCRYLNQYFSALSPQSVDDGYQSQTSDISYAAHRDAELLTADILTTVLQAFQMGDFQLRWDLSKMIPNFGPRAIAPLIELLDEAQDEDDWELSWFIARILGHYPIDQSINALQSLLQSTSQEDVRAVVIDALASMEEAALPALSALVRHPSTRLSAVQALARIHHPDVASILMTVVQDEDAETRAVAIAALSHRHQPEITQLLIHALGDSATAVRRAAVIGVGLQHRMLPEATFLAVLEPLLWDINLEVRRQTVLALSRLQSEPSAHLLFETLCSADTPPMLWRDIVRSLVWTETTTALEHLRMFVHFGGHPSGDSHPETPVMNQMLNQPMNQPVNPRFHEVPAQLQVLHDVATALGSVEHSRLRAIATDTLVDILSMLHQREVYAQPSLGHHVLAIKQAVVHSLGHLGQPQAIPVLDAILNTDPDTRIQLHTRRALEKIK